VIRGLSERTAIEETDFHHTTGLRVLLGSLESGSIFCISNILVSKHLSWRPLRLPDWRRYDFRFLKQSSGY
jgi:hypothetical protein